MRSTERAAAGADDRARAHEVGSHTYTHPNLANAAAARTLFELNATQRLFEAFTGRSTEAVPRALFRRRRADDRRRNRAGAGGAEARAICRSACTSTAEDWQRPGVRAIISNVLERRRSTAATTPDAVQPTTSSCCTIAAATARRRSRRCRVIIDQPARARLPASCRVSRAGRHVARRRRCRRCRRHDLLAACGSTSAVFELLGCFDLRARLPVRRGDRARRRARGAADRAGAVASAREVGAPTPPAIDPDRSSAC